MGFSLAHYFNETVATELKQLRNVYFLQLLFNRSKRKLQIRLLIPNTGYYCEHWILLFLTPNIFLSDNESEFNELFREIDENI